MILPALPLRLGLISSTREPVHFSDSTNIGNIHATNKINNVYLGIFSNFAIESEKPTISTTKSYDAVYRKSGFSVS